MLAKPVRAIYVSNVVLMGSGCVLDVDGTA